MASNSELHLMNQLLNLEEVKVIDYRIIEGIGIILSLENTQKKVLCPNCRKTTELLHQNNFQTVRDLSFGQQLVYLKVNRRRMRCPHCQNKFTEELEFVQKRRVHTLRFVKKIIEEVLNSDIKNVAKRNDLSEQEIETMLKDLGTYLVKEKPVNLKKLGIDEIAVVKGQRNYYVVFVDLEKGKLVGLVEKRTKKEITEHLETWGEKVLSKIQEVSIDLWKPYKNIAKELMPQAEIVADRFHVMKQVTDELDSARRKIKREAEKLKSKSQKEKILSGLTKSKYVLLKNEQDLNEDEKEKLKEVEKVAPVLTKMHVLKEKLRNIFESSKDWREGLFNLADWLKDISDYFPKSFGTIKRWIGEIVTYFDERTTQGIVEGINNKLKLIKRRAFGFRNFNNFQLRSLLTWHFAS
ncbi:ISL3 family transposase [Pleurocapsales cyanobacterium LEGE 10410]|nr:ISL3 family transposase [Pleurocapsales cyanobacterium LEGE 10410]